MQKLAAKHGKPVVIICGCKQDIPKELDKDIYDLVSLFDIHTSMTQTALCLEKLVAEKAPLFPALSTLV